MAIGVYGERFYFSSEGLKSSSIIIKIERVFVGKSIEKMLFPEKENRETPILEVERLPT